VEQVLREAFGVCQEFGEVVLASAVELLLRRAAEHFIDDGGVLALEPFMLFENLSLVDSRTQSSRRRTVMGSMTLRYSGGR